MKTATRIGMKLYATITSERATKGQGGNEHLKIDIMNEEQKVIAYLYVISTDSLPVIGFFSDIKEAYIVTSQAEFGAIVERQRKGKKQKGESWPQPAIPDEDYKSE